MSFTQHPFVLFCHIINAYNIHLRILSHTVLRVNDTGYSISIPNIADIALSNELIGSYSVDLMSVYKHKDHELWQQWGILYNSIEADDVDQQGQIKFSVCVLGPGDIQKMHDPSTEVEEDEEDDEENADIGKFLNFFVFL